MSTGYGVGFPLAPFVFADWLSQRTLNAPFVAKSHEQRPLWDAKKPRPFCDSHSASVEFKKDIRPSIGMLLDWCGPSAVVWRVWSRIVDTIQRASGWSLTHVRQEVFKAVTPTVADSNPSRSVVVIVRGFRVMASAFSSEPGHVFSRVFFGDVCMNAFRHSRHYSRK